MTDRPKIPPCAAIILAGGLNSRMGGRNKAFLQVDGKAILDRLVSVLSPIFDEILLVTRQPDCYAGQSLKIVTDLYEDRSSLTGIHAGLINAASPHAFVVPCDAPFLKPAVVRLLLEALKPELDVVVPAVGGHFQPLCAIYSRRCIPAIEAQLDQGDYKIIRFYDRMRVKTIGAPAIQAVDPQMHSFFNINTPEALADSRRLTQDGGY